MATTTAEQLIEALAASLKKTAEDGLSGFRENEDSATFIPLSQFATALKLLADDEVVASINNAGEAARPKFRSIFNC